MIKLGEAVLRRERHWSYRRSLESKAHGVREAARLFDEGLHLSCLTGGEFQGLSARDVRKAAIVLKLRRNTTVSMEWLAAMLKMKSAANVRQQIWRAKVGKTNRSKLSKELEIWSQ
jgi:hypothetical protein